MKIDPKKYADKPQGPAVPVTGLLAIVVTRIDYEVMRYDEGDTPIATFNAVVCNGVPKNKKDDTEKMKALIGREVGFLKQYLTEKEQNVDSIGHLCHAMGTDAIGKGEKTPTLRAVFEDKDTQAIFAKQVCGKPILVEIAVKERDGRAPITYINAWRAPKNAAELLKTFNEFVKQGTVEGLLPEGERWRNVESKKKGGGDRGTARKTSSPMPDDDVPDYDDSELPF